MEWNFKRTESGIPVGVYRMRIAEATKEVSKSGNDMIVLTLDISGKPIQIKKYLVFLADYPQITNQNLTQVFDSFGIDEADFDLNNWVGKVGAGKTKINDDGYSEIQYFVKKNRQDDLPEWEEPNGGKTKGSSKPKQTKPNPNQAVPDENLPF